ncbi:MAG TPA: class I SAM-dependent methyltransferase [Thermoanaerobaculia bacterium]|nr:class I SAM-dependent methyltransferase [Thermoanaerobaculia bacterium]
MSDGKRVAAGTGGSVAVRNCQVCGSDRLEPVIFIGYLPPVNAMLPVGSIPEEQPAYPAQMLRCSACTLVQLGLIVDPQILFPPSYPYTSGTTSILRENFAELSREVMALYPLAKQDLVVDIGSNDGTLLSNFAALGNPVFGIEPTNAGKLANERGIETTISFFNDLAAADTLKRKGKARIVTATNVFAHIEGIHGIVDAILTMLHDDGIFISESHYLLSLVETLQYDTIYHEHLRYYALGSLRHLLAMHDLEVIHARRIPTHGGSIRVYAARKGRYPVQSSVDKILKQESDELTPARLAAFRQAVVQTKLDLHALLGSIKKQGGRVFGIGAPSRASTLINYVGLDDGILDCVLEIQGSYKIGKYIPGTLVPVVDESLLFSEQPDYALLLSWHIADELIPKLRARGFKGRFIVPLPVPRIISGE